MNNEYLIQKETLTGLADEIRVLSGATTPISTEEMTSSVADANDEVSAQASLIDEISALLDGKSVPGSGSSAAVDTCSVRFVSQDYECVFIYNTISEGAISTQVLTTATDTVIENVVCGSSLTVYKPNVYYFLVSGLSTIYISDSDTHYIYAVTCGAGGEATIESTKHFSGGGGSN